MGHITGREPSKPQRNDITGREPKLGKDALRKHSDKTPIESWDDPRITWGNAYYQKMELSIPHNIVRSVLRSFRPDNVVCLQAHKIHGTEDETRLYLKIITPNSPNFAHWDERGVTAQIGMVYQGWMISGPIAELDRLPETEVIAPSVRIAVLHDPPPLSLTGDHNPLAYWNFPGQP